MGTTVENLTAMLGCPWGGQRKGQEHQFVLNDGGMGLLGEVGHEGCWSSLMGVEGF